LGWLYIGLVFPCVQIRILPLLFFPDLESSAQNPSIDRVNTIYALKLWHMADDLKLFPINLPVVKQPNSAIVNAISNVPTVSMFCKICR
jgi:hypothetical protein